MSLCVEKDVDKLESPEESNRIKKCTNVTCEEKLKETGLLSFE